MLTLNKIGKNIIASIIIYCICGIISNVYAEYELKTWLPQIKMGKSINVLLKYKNDTASYRFKCIKSGIYYIDFSMELYGDSMAYSVGITDAYNNKVYPRIDRNEE
ncbi:MAG TPA: hypothetical protein VIO64_07035 [Pseudobacteroides sp.]|uniref:hypothetical protein n=1 Tax=Pseudobacteroides sp. TaxID=1968840 RepID=UPI002F953547